MTPLELKAEHHILRIRIAESVKMKRRSRITHDEFYEEMLDIVADAQQMTKRHILEEFDLIPKK